MEAQLQDKEQKVTKNMLIGEITSQFPASATVIQKYGLHCVGCHVSFHETLEEGALGHGMSEQDVDNMVKDINTVLNQPKPEGIEVTSAAASKVKDLMKKEGKEGYALRVSITAGGCSGFNYELAFVEKGEEGDVASEKDNLRVFVDQDSKEQLDGVRIDFVDSLQESGFKINNPNAQSTCGCGKSFN
jgi:iron-sulfur cluster assembly accessory protein